MLSYAFQLALRGFRRNTVLTALMVLAVALGIGVAMSMFTVLHNLAGNLLPQRGDEVFHPQIDPRPADLPGARRAPPDNLTYIDALNLYHLDQARQRALMSASWLPLRSTVAGSPLRMENLRATTHGFFPMFDVPFQYGAAWSEQDDTRRAQVVVISQKLNDQLFGGADSVGRELIIDTKLFRIVGVIKPWNPQPHFWDLDDGVYGPAVQMYLPFFTWLHLPADFGWGPMDCWGDHPNVGNNHPKAAQCTWVQYWVQLNTPAQVRAYRDLLVRYSQQQHALGRFQRAPNVRLYDVMQWLNYKHVVPVIVSMQTWIAFGVFVICLLNAVGLLLAKFLRRGGEIGVRRALGARRRDVFAQCVIESALIGLLGGLVGLPLVWLGLWLIRQQPVSYAATAQISPLLLVYALLLAAVATLLAGIWPAWRAARIAPALVVKSL